MAINSSQAIDLLIVGGGLGGVAATLSALDNGLNVILTEETDWLGGQVTSQAVPPDEHPWIEDHGGNASYRRFRNGIRKFYQRNYPLETHELSNVLFNPGRAKVSNLSHEPRIAEFVINEMLAAGVSSQRLKVFKQVQPVAVETSGDRIVGVSFLDRSTGNAIFLDAAFVLDATETGDLLELAKIGHVTGAEGRNATGELHAISLEPRPLNVQAITWVAALGFDKNCPEQSDQYRIAKPALYDYWKEYRPQLSPPWPGRLLDWSYTNPFSLRPVERTLFPDFWHYRRIVAEQNFKAPEKWNEASILNWPQNDYLEHDIICCTPEEREIRFERARQLTLSLVYWLQNEAPRMDGGEGFAGIHLRPDITGTPDGLAKGPYIREARRIKALRTVTELDIGVKAREGRRPDPVHDSVGTGYYRIDLHPTTEGDNYVDVESFPFQIPLGALISPQFSNFLPAAKNIGTTHISNGCFRLHPVEWNIGEAAGSLAAYCLAYRLSPQAVYEDRRKLSDFQAHLIAQGAQLEWNDSILNEHQATHMIRQPDSLRESVLSGSTR